MEELGVGEYSLYQEIEAFLESVELDSLVGFDWKSLGLPDEAMSSSQDENHTDGSCSTTSSTATKSVIMERNRRRKFNDKLRDLRSMVPNISKMDKISIIKDAINYIERLQEEEKKLLEETSAARTGEEAIPAIAQNDCSSPERRKKTKTEPAERESMSPPIEVTYLQLSDVDERTSLLSIGCHKRRGTIVKLYQLFDSLRLKVLSGNITSSSGLLLHNLVVKTEQIEIAQLKAKIEMAIAGLEVP